MSENDRKVCFSLFLFSIIVLWFFLIWGVCIKAPIRLWFPIFCVAFVLLIPLVSFAPKGYKGITLFVSGSVFFSIVSVFLSRESTAEVTLREQIKRAEMRQSDFDANVWFTLAPKMTSESQWQTATVREQQIIVRGIYQTKVMRDSDNTIFLTLAGRELSPGEKVEVAMFEYKAWQGSLPGLIHMVK